MAAAQKLAAANAKPKDTVNDTNASFFRTSVVPDPVAVACTRWGERVSRGSYSHAPSSARATTTTGSAGREGRVLFAGEHTCREHPDTVGGAMLSGWRAARHAMHIMRGDAEPFDEVRIALPTLDDLADDEPAGDDSVSDDSVSDDDESDDDELDDDDTNEREKRKGKKKKRRRGDDDGPEDDDAARERARERLARGAAERREQLERDAKRKPSRVRRRR